MPAQCDLCGRPVNTLGDLADRRILEHSSLRNRRPGLGENVVLLAVRPDLLVGEVRMHLDLVHRGYGLGLVCQALQVVDLEIGETNRARPPVCVELLQCLPGRDKVTVVERRQRPVDQEQVNVVEAEGLQGLVERPPSVVGSVVGVVQLARHEDVTAIDPRSPDAFTDTLLVAVRLRRIDVAITDVQCLAHRISCLRGIDLEDTESKLRDGLAVVHLKIGHVAHRIELLMVEMAGTPGTPSVYPTARNLTRATATPTSRPSTCPFLEL